MKISQIYRYFKLYENMDLIWIKKFLDNNKFYNSIYLFDSIKYSLFYFKNNDTYTTQKLIYRNDYNIYFCNINYIN
jgi:hypothetical protein